MKGCNQSFVWWYTHLITDSVLAVHVTMVSICNLEKMKVFSCRVSFSDWFFRVPALILTCFRYIFCNHFVFENATNIAFLLCYWKNKNKKQFSFYATEKTTTKNAWSWWTHTTKTSLQSVQGCQPAEHCKKRSLKKLITATRRDYTWKSTTKSGIVWQNWTQNRVVEGAKSMHRSTVLCNSGLPPQNMRIHARGPQIHPSDFHCAQNLL